VKIFLIYYVYKFLSFLFSGDFLDARAEKYRLRLKNANIVKNGKSAEYARNFIHHNTEKCCVIFDNIKVDVVVPVYKGLLETQACISSVLKNFPNWAELIVINDASPDVLLSEWLMYIPLGERELAKEIEQRGIALGMEKGREEIARKLLARGDYSLKVVSEIAGLPVERIQNLIS